MTYVAGWFIIAMTTPQTAIFIPCLVFRMWNDRDGTHEYIAARTIDGARLRNEKYFMLPFDPQPDSRDQQYIVSITSFDAKPENSVSAWMQSGDPYPQGRLWIGDREAQGDLAFKLVYQP
jgi:hypothetical protein